MDPFPIPEDRPWHAQSPDDVLQALASQHEGLSPEETAARLARHGLNTLPMGKARHPLLRFLLQFHSTLIYVLLAAALIAGLLGHALDAAVIAAVVLVNALVGFLQEGKAEKALSAIRSLVSPRAHVLRAGQRLSVPVADLVPGDVVLLEPGDRIPADLRLLRARGLLIDEALLTGESMAAQKHDQPAPPDAPLGDRHSMAYSGTLVASGQASGVVVATGPGTELGRIGTLVAAVQNETTPLLRQIDRFGRFFAVAVLVAGSLLFLHAVQVQRWATVDALLAVVAIAVAVIPEGLPAVITITLAIGVQRMAAHNAVIRRLPAVETLGATSVICTDKTGTLTRNEMTARHVIGPRHTLVVDGEGYAPHGSLRATEGDDAGALAEAVGLLRCAMLCNDAHLRLQAGAWTVVGDPMEGALLALAGKAGLAFAHERIEWPRLDEIPFDAAHRFMAALHRGPDGEPVVFVKGAPERLFDMADSMAAPLRERWANALTESASRGERLLAFGAKRLPRGTTSLRFEDVADGVEVLGLVGFIDPPRQEVQAAIAQCRSAGILVKMITGDHAVTAMAIARELRLSEQPAAITGAELDRVSDAELPALVYRTQVFARTSPEHKLRIVRALQQRGEVVAMTGDGVNDAPSLKQADVGVAMGIKGTEAAKEAAEMVLLDDNFASIVQAVNEGRTVFDNVRKVFAWTLPTNGGQVLGAVICVLFGLTLPMSAAQILWVNLVTSATLGLALAFEPAEPGVMSRPPRDPLAPLVSGFMLWRIVLVSVLFAAVTLGLRELMQARGEDIDTSRTLVVNALVAMQVGYLFNVRYLGMRSLTWRGALGTGPVLLALFAVVLAQGAFTYLPVMNSLFATVPLSAAQLAMAVGAGAGLMLVLEAEKWLTRSRRAGGTGASSSPVDRLGPASGRS